VIADYRATVRAINAYLADGSQQKLDASFTYRAGLWEEFQSIFYLVFGAATLFIAWGLWTKRVCTFEPAKVTFVERRWFRHSMQEIGADRIIAIVERPVLDRQVVELQLADLSAILVVETERTGVRMTGLARELAELLRKPLQAALT